MDRRATRPPRQALALISLGVGVIGIAYTLRPPAHASPVVFWAVLLLGILATAVGALSRPLRRKDVSFPAQAECDTAATECDRYADELTAYLDGQVARKPRSLPFGNGTERVRRWRDDIKAGYRADFMTWGLETFDTAARLNAVPKSSRGVVTNPSPEQLGRLPALFRDAATSLRAHCAERDASS
jgi:hypothetical protein